MAELTEAKSSGCLDRALGFLLLFVVLIPLFYVDGIVRELAASKCADGTFLAGRIHRWDGWGFAFFGAAIWMLAGQVIGRVRKKTGRKAEPFFAIVGKIGLGVLITFAAATAIIYWIASSSQFCLAKNGIHHRSLPWQPFQRHAWSDVRKVTVECSNGHRSPDLYYTLTFKDGMTLDVADAFPAPKQLPQFQAQLASVPFQFSADVRSSCPEWYSGWVGQKP